MVTVVKNLPVNPQKGEDYTIRTSKGRLITFKATGKKGFGKWKIVSNMPA